jgi:ABC-type sugar transport system permease subunit
MAQQVTDTQRGATRGTTGTSAPGQTLGQRVARGMTGYLFILPTFLFLAYFLYYPAFTALRGAFTDWDGFNEPRWVGLANFQQALGDRVLRTAALNNIVWAIFKIVLHILPPFIVAELIFHLRSTRAQYLYRSLFIVPLVVPTLVEILLWKYYYSSSGLLNQILDLVGLNAFRQQWLGDPDVALYSLILMGFPWIGAFNLLIFYSALQGISKEVLEAGSMDGAVGLQRIWQIDIPLLRPQFRLLLVLATISSVQAILEPLVMTEGGPRNATMLPGLHMYYQATKYSNYGYSMSIAFMMLVVILAITFINNRLLKERG